MFPNLASLAQPWSARKIPRRVFLKRVISGAGSYPLALALLQKFGSATPLSSVDETRNWGVAALPVKFPGQGATLEGYLAKPARRGPHPALILIHRDDGLNEHLRDVARDYAKEGFVALAVDPLSRRGGTASFASPDDARQAIATLDGSQLQADLDAASAYLQRSRSVQKGLIRLTGFSRSGQRAFPYATSNPNLTAAGIP